MKMIKKICFACCLLLSVLAGSSQKPENTLLWRISGKDLQQPSYLFGTMHMLCAKDIRISDSLQSAIGRAEAVYLEVDMNNMMEMMGAMSKMKMRNDTTLQDLLSAEEYQQVKNYFEQNKSILPFRMLQSYKPMIAAATIMQASMDCPTPVVMEQLVMEVAKDKGKKIKGLESMAYQMGIFDSIPYKYQADQLVKYIRESKTDTTDALGIMTRYYLSQDLKALEAYTLKESGSLPQFTNILLYNRNRNWVKKMRDLLPKGGYVFAVGAGHLPGSEGVIHLLRREGYKVEPVPNQMVGAQPVAL